MKRAESVDRRPGGFWYEPEHKPSYLVTDGWVYFIQGEEGGLIKIGWATNVKPRLTTLQMNCPIRLKVLAQVKGTATLEREYHKQFAAHRKNGEWFEPAPEIMRLVGVLAGEQT